jgi:hypothetical protein
VARRTSVVPRWVPHLIWAAEVVVARGAVAPVIHIDLAWLINQARSSASRRAFCCGDVGLASEQNCFD